MSEEDFKKSFEEANPGTKLTSRTKEKTISLTKRLTTSLGLIFFSTICFVLSGAPVYGYLFVPVLGLLGYFGYRPELDKDE